MSYHLVSAYMQNTTIRTIQSYPEEAREGGCRSADRQEGQSQSTKKQLWYVYVCS